MAKKIIIPFCLLLIVLLSGCGQDKQPKDISEPHYKYGLKALEIVDSYLDFDTTSKEAKTTIEALISEKGNLPETGFEHPNHAKDFSVESKVSLLDYSLLNADLGKGSYDDILNKRNTLANLLNIKER